MSAALGALDAEIGPEAVQPATAEAGANTMIEAKEAGGGYTLGWSEYAIVAVIALLVSAAVFTTGWFLLAKPAVIKVGVIDLPGIVEIEELSLTASMIGSQVTDADRANAFERLKAFGPKLEAAIEQAKSECGCILLTRNAMVGPSNVDQTARVKEILGMSAVSAAELREKITKNVQAIPDGQKR